jgi:hypothetical protein
VNSTTRRKRRKEKRKGGNRTMKPMCLNTQYFFY